MAKTLIDDGLDDEQVSKKLTDLLRISGDIIIRIHS